ncbi:MAG: DUF1573 domain-containing protein [Bacteroidales bacterium]|nr:DUF1573 domain-containing protein [Bacteroidales bacterium]
MKKIILCICSCISLLAVVACGNSGGEKNDVSIINNPNSATGYDSTISMPRIVFDQNQHDFGRLSPNEQVAYSFHFRNDGNANLVITSCETSCGCTIADYPRGVIAPGGDGYISVTFKSPSGRSGQQVKEVTVNTNAQPATTRLRILAQVM